ncbi:MAG: hypothetical protein K2K54_07840 [Lachnospiraceae bacterium]|nr:hypothetical protein [Lachnospiraceae bacterium]
MKKRLSPVIKHLLVSCMGISFWVSITHASVLFFGEYAYPKKEDFKN